MDKGDKVLQLLRPNWGFGKNSGEKMQDNTEKCHYCTRCLAQDCRECREKSGRVESIGLVSGKITEKRFAEAGFEGVKTA